MIRIGKYLIITSVVSMLISVQCNQNKEINVIAKVGKSTLTLDDLKRCIPTEYSDQITPDQYNKFVIQWINNELLSQEAINQKIDKEIVIKERIRKMKTDLLSAEMLNRFSQKIQPDSIKESDIEDFYNLNRNNFIRQKDYVKYLDIAVDESAKAWELYRTTNKNNFVSVAAQYSKTPTFDSANIPYTSLDVIQSEIRQALSNLALNSVSMPVKTSNGYHILFYIDKLNKGDICTLQEVKKEILDQIVNEKQKNLIDQILADLRIKTNVEYNKELLSDSIIKQIF